MGTLNSEFYAVAEGDNIAEQGRVEICRDRAFTCHPFKKIAVKHFQDMLEFVKLRIGEADNIFIRILPKDQIHLAHSAMPCAKQKLAAPYIQIFRRQCAASHPR